jgi:hypothetical protein
VSFRDKIIPTNILPLLIFVAPLCPLSSPFFNGTMLTHSVEEVAAHSNQRRCAFDCSVSNALLLEVFGHQAETV